MALARHPVTRTWLLLVAATLCMFALAEGADVAAWATPLVIVIAGLKVRLVFLHFMELDTGAMPWRAVAEIWVAVVTLMLLVLYLS